MNGFKFSVLTAACLLAASTASAGTLQVTPVQYAAETITVGGKIKAPVFSYSLAAPLSVTSSPIFTAEFKLSNTLWASGVDLPALADVVLVSPNGLNSIHAKSVALNAAGDTLIVTFKVMDATNAGLEVPSVAAGNGGGTLPTAGYTFPIGSNIIVGRTQSPKVVGTAAMLAPANECEDTVADTEISVVVKNAVGIVTETAAPLNVLDRSVYLRSGNAIKVSLAATNIPGSSNTEKSKIDMFTGSLGTRFTAEVTEAGNVTQNEPNMVNIGMVVFEDRPGSFIDAASPTNSRYAVKALPSDNSFANTGSFVAVPGSGNVSVQDMTLKIDGAFNTLGTVYASRDPNCGRQVSIVTGLDSPLAPPVAPNLASQATLSPTSATFTNLALRYANSVFDASTPGKFATFVCYKRDLTSPVATVIPPSQFKLDRAASSVRHRAGESGSPICGDKAYNLEQNGVKFDLRNVVGKQSQAYTDGWRSFVRLINTDETNAADVTAQVIGSNGTVLAGKVITATPIPPRGYVMLSTDAIEAALAGSASAGYVDTTNANTRLRLTAPTSSLRAQNYLYNPLNNTFIEGSGSQGDEQPGLGGVAPNVLEDARK